MKSERFVCALLCAIFFSCFLALLVAAPLSLCPRCDGRGEHSLMLHNGFFTAIVKCEYCAVSGTTTLLGAHLYPSPRKFAIYEDEEVIRALFERQYSCPVR